MTSEVGTRGPVPPGGLPVGVVGAGSWGTAVAIHATHAGHRVVMWGHDRRKVARMQSAGENEVYLPGFAFPAGLTVTTDAAAAMAGADIVLSVVPSRHLRTIWARLGPLLGSAAHLVSATKGIEEGTCLRMSEVIAACLPLPPASMSSLSGPSFARELAEDDPTAVALGCEDADAGVEVRSALSYGPLRVYTNRDLVGVELGGALKNVIAIAAGIVDGLSLGTNSRAALICRGLKEMAALGARLGAEPSTMMGLAGLGDLVLTCTGPLSRNRRVGMEIGRGRSLDEVTAAMEMVAEGVVTVRSARELAARVGLEMPITEQVFQVLYGGMDPRDAIERLLSRDLGDEWGR